MKTIEEASLENSKNHYIMAFSDELHKDADMDFKAGVEFAQRWIPVEEKKPELDPQYAAEWARVSITVEARKGMRVESAYYHHSTNRWRSMITSSEIFPTHWRYIDLK